MRRQRAVISLVVALLLALAPAVALARAGSGGSFGSRGSRTYSAPPSTQSAPYGASPMQRSLTQPGYSGGAYSGGYACGYGGGGYGGGGFGRGLAGGLLGFGLGSLLFGGHGYGGGYGYGGGSGILGALIRIAILFFVIRWLFRRFFGGRSLFAGRGRRVAGMMGGPVGGYDGGAMGGAPMVGGPPVQLQQADYAAFDVLLRNIQAAWSNNDLNALRGMASPEMVSIFAEQLADNASRGQRNITSQVQLLKGDLSEAWQENGRDYATVAMQFSMVDVTYDQAGHVVGGNPNQPVTATEFWTFLRAGGGQWLLSAIQQGR